MRAIQFSETGGPEVLHEVDIPEPEPKPGQVRVRHEAIGVNFIDTYHRSGLYPLPLPCVLGVEGAGVVDAVGPGVTHVAIGDRVAYAAGKPGSYAEARVLDATPVCKLPDAIDFATGAAMMLKGLTVQYLLRRTRVALSPGQPILWHAAAGGVGLIACQWAAALGATVIGTVGSSGKALIARAHGCSYVINTREEDLVAKVNEYTKGKGVDVVYDSIGKDTFPASLDCLKPLGLWVSFGQSSGPVPPFDITLLSQKGSLFATRPSLFTYTALRKDLVETANDLFDMVGKGKVKIAINQTYPLAEAAKAQSDLEARRTTGSTVLLP
jgi:NADPH2:quinone reductase